MKFERSEAIAFSTCGAVGVAESESDAEELLASRQLGAAAEAALAVDASGGAEAENEKKVSDVWWKSNK